ncbi:MAG: MGMT family protein [Firmicutes bacterium]|nr:MGMT family protein [Bacillota bacterium]
MTKFTEDVIDIIKMIPIGKVMTYGQIAAYAGFPQGARQVSRILHSMSEKYDLPWHRVINSQGGISLTGEAGYIQGQMLASEGIEVVNKKINLQKHLFKIM